MRSGNFEGVGVQTIGYASLGWPAVSSMGPMGTLGTLGTGVRSSAAPVHDGVYIHAIRFLPNVYGCRAFHCRIGPKEFPC
jgi:hypothetical protein